MNRLKEWCIETVQKAVSVLVTRERKHEESPGKILQLGAELETTRKRHGTLSSNKHLCGACNMPCTQCISFQGSSVDRRSYSNSSEIHDNNTLPLKNQTVETSTQTESLSSYHDLTKPHSTSDLPDLLLFSLSSREPLKYIVPPPPPPPPPPPLPRKLQVSSTLNLTRKKQNTLKKCQSAGVSIQPTITVELLKNVRLRKMRVEDDMCNSKLDHSGKDMANSAHTAVTLEALQKVTLRKADVTKNVDLGTSFTESVANDHMDSGLQDRISTRQSLRRTQITRSPGGTPLLSKRRKLPTKENNSVVCKQKQQGKPQL
uniref:Uncharacterized protein n=1 Tax=Arion vulgaris TaxID=1028688 RepID=A0A0B7A297_9EUPU